MQDDPDNKIDTDSLIYLQGKDEYISTYKNEELYFWDKDLNFIGKKNIKLKYIDYYQIGDEVKEEQFEWNSKFLIFNTAYVQNHKGKFVSNIWTL